MKRDIDLCRQLLFDLEAHGPDCAVNVLRHGPASETDDRVRYHLRLLIDAGLVKEVDRATGSLRSVRLTHAGVELMELCRCDARWRDAKAVVLEQTGGLSLTVLRTILTKWAVEAVSYGEHRGTRRVYGPQYRRLPRAHYDAYRYDREQFYADEELRLARSAPGYRERLDWREREYDVDLNGYSHETVDTGVGVSLPVYLV